MPSFGPPQVMTDTENLPKSQLETTTMIKVLENLKYKETLRDLGLFSLEDWEQWVKTLAVKNCS